MIYWLTQYWGFCSETSQIWSEISQILIRNRSDLDLIRSGYFWSELTSSDQTTWPKTWNLAGKLSDLILSGFWSDQISRVTAKTSPLAYKWAWGTQLTAAEVLGLCRRGTQPGMAPYTRYDISLAEGRLLAGEGSNGPLSILSGQHEDVLANVLLPPPPTTLTHPPHFSRYDQLMYDPLYISAPSIPQMLHTLPAISVGAPAIIQTTSPVLHGDLGKLWTCEGEANETAVQRLV